MQRLERQIVRYALGVAAGVAALLLRKVLDPLLGSANPYHTAWAAVVFSAWLCGVGPAIVTAVLTAAGIWYWFLPPYGSLRSSGPTEIFGMLGFLAFSAVIIALGERSRRTIDKLEQAERELRRTRDELEDRIRERTADLAERTAKLEQQSRELADQAAMLDLANDAIFVRTVADTISFWNEGAERLYGWSKQEAMGRSPYDLLHTEFPVPLESVKGRETWEGELRHTKRDGTLIIVASRWRTLRDPSGAPLGWLEINTDITSRKRAEHAARSLSGRILTLQDEERRRIARDLHDSLGQYLAALKMNLDGLPVNNAELAKIVSDCIGLVSTCLAETRTISHLLHPPLLDEAGLASAARLFVDEFSRRSGIAVSFELSPESMRLPSDIEIALFRAVQEALTNVHRHSGATSVEIRLTLEGKRVRLEIHDNGRGIPQERLNLLAEGTAETGVGLAGMRERLRELDGSLEIQSNAAGTTVIVTTPAPAQTPPENGVLVA
jgi:PAS domain S-box-containing protein